MTVNINPAAPSSVTALTGTREIQAAKIATPDKQSAQLPQDHTTLNSVGNLVKAALQQPEVRADKVSALKDAVSSGTYKVDPQAIASSIVADQG